MNDHIQVRLIDDELEPMPFEGLSALICSDGVDRFSLLVTLSVAAVNLPSDGIQMEPPVTSSALALLMAALLSGKVLEVPPIEDEVKVFDVSGVPRLVPAAFAVDAYDQKVKEGIEDNSFAPSRTTARSLWSMYLDHSDSVIDIARIANLTGIVGLEGALLPPSNAIQDTFAAHYGFSVSEMFFVLFSASAVTKNGPFVHLPTFLRNVCSGSELRQKALKVLDAFSATPQHAYDVLNSPEYKALPGMSRSNKFFSRFPFIKIEDDRYLLSAPTYLAHACFRQPYFSVRDAAAEQVSVHGASNYDNSISREMGRRFEDYAFHVFSKAMPQAEISMPDFEYCKGQRTPDGIFIGREGRDCILMQAKAKLPAQSLTFGDTTRAIYDDFHPEKQKDVPAYTRLIVASIRFLHNLNAAYAKNRVFPQHRGVAKAILQSRQIYLVGVVPFVPPVFEYPSFNSAMERSIQSHLRKDQYEWYVKQRGSGRIVAWHIDSIDAYETYAGYILNKMRWMPKTINAWRRDTSEVMKRVESNGDLTLPLSFRDFCRQTVSDGPPTRMPELLRCFDSLTKLIGERFKEDLLKGEEVARDLGA